MDALTIIILILMGFCIVAIILIIRKGIKLAKEDKKIRKMFDDEEKENINGGKNPKKKQLIEFFENGK
jgi:hypothetical protein